MRWVLRWSLLLARGHFREETLTKKTLAGSNFRSKEFIKQTEFSN